MAWFNALVAFVNSIPPCDQIDCVPDFLEDLVAFIIGLIEAIFGGWGN